VLVLRELAAAGCPELVRPGQTLLWDRRFEVAAPREMAHPVTIGHLADAPAVPVRLPEIKICRGSLPRFLHGVLPAIWDDDGLLAVPHLGYHRTPAGAFPRIAFRPANPLSPTGFTVV
jgi:tRNA(Ile)-lysidine synthase